MTLEQEIVEEMATKLANEMDFHILTDMLCSIGWTRVVLKPMMMETGQEIDQWVKDYCKSGVEFMGLVWVFEDPKEAAWFTLRWL
jgi:hypothetical protein